LVAASLLRWAGFEPALARLRDVLALVLLASVGSTAVSATLGVLSLWAGGAIHPDALGATWRAWWVGDAPGALVVGPLLFTWLQRSAWRWRRPGREAGLLILALVASSVAVFFDLPSGADSLPRQAYLTFPFLIWAALRFRQRGAVLAIFLVSAIA